MNKFLKVTRSACACVFANIGLLAGSAFAAEDPKPLFADDALIKIRIEAPFSDLIGKASRSTDPYPATLHYESDQPETHNIELSARGKSRRDKQNCKFPPLRVEFTEKPADESFFDGQKRLKLVTHCRASSRYQQYYLLEHAAYKLLNVITPLSLEVRLAEIDYVEAESGKVVTTRLGFFIEDTDDAAKRNDMKEIDVADIKVSQLNADAAAQYALFQYMIGNLDWSMHNGPEGSDCCHNTKLIGATKEATTDLVPVPYDFDYSGLVDAPYAVPPENINVRSVRKRRYRGFCRHDESVKEQALYIAGLRDEFVAVVNSIEPLSDRNKNNSVKYIDDFIETIGDEQKLQKSLLDDCRG